MNRVGMDSDQMVIRGGAISENNPHPSKTV